MYISVVIPCYNCEKLVTQTLDSVVNQTYGDFEVIAIDDCSTDDTYNVINEYSKKDNRINVFKNGQNLGVALTRNKGVELASGEFIAFLDSDDIWELNKLQKQIELLKNDNFIDLCYTSYTLYNSDMSEILSVYNTKTQTSYKKMLYENMIGLSTVLIRKSVFMQYKMSNSYIHEDYVLWLKLLKNDYICKGLSESLVKYRVFDDSRNSSKINSMLGRMKILHYEEKINPIANIYYTLIYSLKGIIKYKL